MRPAAFTLIVAIVILNGCSEEATAPQEQHVQILGGYELNLPSNYEVRSGSGIDTWIFQARRDDEKVVFQLEVGGGTPAVRERFSQLPEVYRFPNRIEFTADGITGAYFYEVIEPRMFREISGTVIWGAGTGGGY